MFAIICLTIVFGCVSCSIVYGPKGRPPGHLSGE